MHLRDLPDDAQRILAKLNAPPRLIAHLAIVHDTACEILDAIELRWPEMKIDRDAVLFGAATHDVGKVLHQNELTGPGNRHEQDGPELLLQNGVTGLKSRFARTHGTWSNEPNVTVEDLIVALADNSWKGTRNEDLESQVAQQITVSVDIETWEAFMGLDEIMVQITSRAEDRLAWQCQSSV